MGGTSVRPWNGKSREAWLVHGCYDINLLGVVVGRPTQDGEITNPAVVLLREWMTHRLEDNLLLAPP